MNEVEFWRLIESCIGTQAVDDEFAIDDLTTQLSQLPPDQIYQFERYLRENILKADHYNVMIPLKIIDDYIGDDSYLYYRCWLISKGREVFEATIANPDHLADYVTLDTEPDLEALLYVSTDAFMISTGKQDEDESFPRNQDWPIELNYDFSIAPTKGEDWEEEDLPLRAPRLCKMFNRD